MIAFFDSSDVMQLSPPKKLCFSGHQRKQGCQMANFKTKIPVWVNLGDTFNGRWYILRPFGIFCGHLVYFAAIWYILWPYGIFYGHLVYLEAIYLIHFYE
jgi:hypothetical protein